MKLIISSALVLMLAVAASATTIQAPTITSVGGTFDLDVQITDVADLYGYQFDIAFNPAILMAMNVSEGPFLPGGGNTFFIPGAIDNIAGTITLTANTLLGPIPGVSGSGTLATISFLPLSIGVSPITLSDVILLDSAFGDISAEVQNGSATVLIPEPNSGFLLGSVIALGLCGRYWLKKHRRNLAD